MQITVPSGGHFLITSKGEHIPLGAWVDVVTGGVTYVNVIFSSMSVGAVGYGEGARAQLEGIMIDADDDLIDISCDELDEITLHNDESDIGALYELATHGLSKDEFIEKFKELAAEYGDGK